MAYKNTEKQREYQREWFRKKKETNEKFADALRKTRSQAKAMKRLFVAEMKGQFGCYFCDENDPNRLDFHHVNPITKTREVSAMAQGNYSLLRIAEEIKKCICVCKNCHADLTMLRKDYLGHFGKKQVLGTSEQRLREDFALARKELDDHPAKKRRDDLKLYKYTQR